MVVIHCGSIRVDCGMALAAENNVSGPSTQQPDPAFKALAQVLAPMSLTDQQLSQIQGALAISMHFRRTIPVRRTR
jgi:hypothetical protein